MDYEVGKKNHCIRLVLNSIVLFIGGWRLRRHADQTDSIRFDSMSLSDHAQARVTFQEQT